MLIINEQVLLNYLKAEIETDHGKRHEPGLVNGLVGLLIGKWLIIVLIVISAIHIVIIWTIGGIMTVQCTRQIKIHSEGNDKI